VADISERKPGTAVKKTAAWSWGEKDGYAGIPLSNRLSMNSVDIDGSRTRTRAGTDRRPALASSFSSCWLMHTAMAAAGVAAEPERKDPEAAA
jgi:hypothetical protein